MAEKNCVSAAQSLCGVALNSVDYFTFEPHISIPGSKYGYKKENIYYFRNGKLTVL